MAVIYRPLLFLLLFTAWSFGQKKPTITGSRNVTQTSIPLESFDRIVLLDEANIHLKIAPESKVVFTADDNLPPVFHFEVVDRVLSITTYYEVKARKQLDIDVYTPDIKSIEIQSGMVDAFVTPEVSDLSLVLQGTSSFVVHGVGGALRATLSDRSRLESNTKWSSLSLSASSRSSAQIHGDIAQISLEQNDRSQVRLSGDTATLKGHLKAESEFDGVELNAGSIEWIQQDNTSATLTATQKVQLSLSGDAITKLYGVPEVSLPVFSDRAQLIKKEF